MSGKPARFKIHEDWWAVILAGVLILLSALGLLGEGGLPITF